MLITPHLLVGGATGEASQNIPLVITASFLSHFLLDMIPHFEPGSLHKEENYKLIKRDWIIIFIDLALGIFLISLLYFSFKNYLILLGAFFAILPDFIDNVPFWKDLFRKTQWGFKFHQIHDKCHFLKLKIWHKFWYFGIIVQVVLIFGILIWFYLGF